MRYGQNGESIIGEWMDGRRAVNTVRFKKAWGQHVFSSQEIEELLSGNSISFINNKGIFIKGHLQYQIYQDEKGEKHKYFGFCSTFSKQYTIVPTFDPTVHSKYTEDIKKEGLMRSFMRLYYYSKLLNSDGTSVQVDYVEDKNRQVKGADVIYIRDEKKYVIDEKAQMDYIRNPKGPLPSFALELLNSSSGKQGWFINDDLETGYYMFIWPHADSILKSVNNIEYAMYDLVEKQQLKKYISTNFPSGERLKHYAMELSKEKLEGAYEEDNRLKFKKAPFNQSVYLVYTKEPTIDKDGKKEKPVNLVVKKHILDKMAEEKGVLRRIIKS